MSTFLGLMPFVFGTVAIVVYARAKRPVVRSLGLNVSRWSPLEVLIGLAITFVAIGATLVAELGLGAIRLEPGPLTWRSLGTDLLAQLIPAAAIEELLYRVLLLSGLAVVLSPLRRGRWIAVLLSAALFGAAHLANPGASWVAAVGTGLGGVMYGVAFLGTRSVWLPFGLHLGWNLAQGVFGFPISGHVVPGIFSTVPTADDVLVLTGGTYGPEAGIPGMLARFVVIGLVVLYLRRRWPDGRFGSLTYAPEPVRRRR
ncbi:MAG TPA: CPBP family intramembrane glutamic endopeptidase [Microlunatus sp.]